MDKIFKKVPFSRSKLKNQFQLERWLIDVER
jgi:hypothetical protein